MNDPTNEPQKKVIKGGKGMMNGSTGKRYSATYQPDQAKVLMGREKKKLLKDILTAPLLTHGVHKKGIELCAKYMQIDPDQVTLADLLHFKQAQKAYQKGDTFAYQALMDRTFGKPENRTTLSGDPANPIVPLNEDQVNILIQKIQKGVG